MAIGGDTSHDHYRRAAEAQLGAVNELAEAYTSLKDQQLSEMREVLEAQQQVTGQLAEGTEEAEGFAGGLGNVGRTLGQVKGQLAAVAGIAAAAAAAVRFVGDETARLDQVAKSAQKSGLGFDAYQRLEHVATLSGTSIQAVEKSVLALNVRLRDVKGSGRIAVETLGDLGINAEELAKQSPEEQLATIAGALGQLPDGAQKSAMAFEILGKSGKELIPLFNAGADGVRDMAAAVGTTFSREELARAEAYQDALANMNRQADVIKGTLAVELAPALTQIADGLTEGGREGERVLPMLIGYLTTVGQGLKPVVQIVAFFGGQLATVGRVIEVTGGYLERGTDRAREFGASLATTVRESEFVEWADNATKGIRSMADEGLAALDSAIEKHLPWASEVGATWDEIRRSISGANAEAQQFGAIQKGRELLGAWLDKAKDTGEDIAAAREREVEALQRSVTDAEHAVKLAEAQKRPAAELEKLYGEQHLARLALYSTTKDLDALEREMAGEELRRAAAAARRRGGRGPSDADRMRAEGEAMLQLWRDRLRLAELEGEASGRAAEQAQQLADVSYRIAVEELELERQVLEVTRARNSVERRRNEARLEAIEREKQILDLEKTLADRRAEAELIERATQETRERAAVEAEIRRQEQAALAEVISLEEYRGRKQVEDIELAGRLAEEQARTEGERLAARQRTERDLHEARMRQMRVEHEAAVRELDARQAAAEAMPTGTDAERLARQDELREVAHDREVERLSFERDMRRELEAEQIARLQREKERQAQQLAMVEEYLGAFEQIYAQARDLGGFLQQRRAAEEDAALQQTVDRLQQRGQAQREALQAEIDAAEGNAQRQAELRRKQAQQEAATQRAIEKAQAQHQERRRRQEARAAGWQLMIEGVVQSVKAVAAFAGFNYVQGALHLAAAAFAFTKGGMLLAGRIPGGGASAGPAMGGGGMAANDSSYTDPSNVPGSVPGEAARRESASETGTSSATRGGGTTVVINGPINALGTIDRAAVGNLATQIDRYSYSRER